ncbi:hypothetical protein LIER_40185 [Lithospermum erythrorhizon]|uniref:Uncharacterized protein n=1 Tax=Lithospermum erythrorhizon TaxID=34254 RepID=A0AAV3QTU2_LITER
MIMYVMMKLTMRAKRVNEEQLRASYYNEVKLEVTMRAILKENLRCHREVLFLEPNEHYLANMRFESILLVSSSKGSVVPEFLQLSANLEGKHRLALNCALLSSDRVFNSEITSLSAA